MDRCGLGTGDSLVSISHLRANDRPRTVARADRVHPRARPRAGGPCPSYCAKTESVPNPSMGIGAANMRGIRNILEKNRDQRAHRASPGWRDAMVHTKASAQRQLTIFPRGGWRRRAGRKPAVPRARVTHAVRPRLTPRDPVIVTTRLLPGLPSLRRESTLMTMRRVLAAGSERFGFRLVEFSVQTNHLHLIAEAGDARSLARGMQGLLVRVAKALNREWGRRGKVLGDRYHARILRSPRDVRHVLVYVIQNARKHGAQIVGIDPYSSGPWFDGWIDRIAGPARPIAIARSWLLTTGWRRAGLLSTRESPVVRESG